MRNHSIGPVLILILLSFSCVEEPMPMIMPLPGTAEHEVLVHKNIVKETKKSYEEPDSESARRLRRIRKRYLPEARPVSIIVEGSLEEGQSAAYRFLLLGPHTNGTPRCYHFFAVVADDRADLDMELFTHKDDRMTFDNQIDFYPMARYICPPNGAKGYVLIRMTRGSGSFCLRIYQYDEMDLNPETLFKKL